MKEGIGFVENSVLHTLNEASEIFSASQASYSEGQPAIKGRRVSELLSEYGLIIGALHTLKVTLVYQHIHQFSEPFNQLPRQFEIFCCVLRHCVNQNDRKHIDALSLLFSCAAEYIANNRESNQEEFDNKVQEFYLKIRDTLTGPIRQAVVSREKAIEDGVAEPIKPTNDERSSLANEMKYANHLLSCIVENTRRQPPDRESVIKLVHKITVHTTLSETCGSIPKAVNYIRYVETPLPDLSEEIVNARLIAQQNPRGANAFWNSIKTCAKKSNYKKKKAKSDTAPPGPVSILYRGAESLAQE